MPRVWGSSPSLRPGERRPSWMRGWTEIPARASFNPPVNEPYPVVPVDASVRWSTGGLLAMLRSSTVRLDARSEKGSHLVDSQVTGFASDRRHIPQPKGFQRFPHNLRWPLFLSTPILTPGHSNTCRLHTPACCVC